MAAYHFGTEHEIVDCDDDSDTVLVSYFLTRTSHRLWGLLGILDTKMIGMNTGNTSATDSPSGGMKLSAYGIVMYRYVVSQTGTSL